MSWAESNSSEFPSAPVPVSSDTEVYESSNANVEFEQRLFAARNGCRETLGTLLDSMQTYLMMLARTQVRPSDASKMNPSDAVQCCNLNAISFFPDFQGSTQQELQSWLKTILLNTLATERRRNRRPLTPEKVDQAAWGSLLCHVGELHVDDSTASSVILRNEREARLWQLLAALPERYRQVVTMRRFQKLTFPQIAKELGCSSNAACHLWVRALEELGTKAGNSGEW